MIKHIVLWQLKDEAEGKSKTENAAAICERLTALKGKIPELRSIQVGTDVMHGAGSFDCCLIAEFDSPEALKVYNDHPLHQEVLKFIRSVISSRIACDIEE